MKRLARHVILTAGKTQEHCKTQVLHFFERTSLVSYDQVVIDEDLIISGSDNEFWKTLEQALMQNQEVLRTLVKELGETGFDKRAQLPQLEQGYPSKVLHIIAHFLDGFIGIDTIFYNLIDDSHWLPGNTSDKIKSVPERYWLFSVEGYSMTPREEVLLHM
ncbi:MAG: hypothetical protein KJO32_13020 [Deltaproteobacteria bacterium]|nr:hypothetical protein [Deltaproteobacteria bacterium]